MTQEELKRATLGKIGGGEKHAEVIDRILKQYPARYRFDGRSVQWLERQVKLVMNLEGGTSK